MNEEMKNAIKEAIDGCNYKAITDVTVMSMMPQFITKQDTVNCYNPKHNDAIAFALNLALQARPVVDVEGLREAIKDLEKEAGFEKQEGGEPVLLGIIDELNKAIGENNA